MPKKKKTMLDGDPPILVGGGGSSFIWIRKDLDPQLFDPSNVSGDAPGPAHRDQYFCLKVKGNVAKIDVNDGSGSSGPKPANDKKFKVQFDF